MAAREVAVRIKPLACSVSCGVSFWRERRVTPPHRRCPVIRRSAPPTAFVKINPNHPNRAVCSLLSLPWVLILSALAQTKYRLFASIIV